MGTESADGYVHQAPATTYVGNFPQGGVVYCWANPLNGQESQYFLPSGERLKNGKYCGIMIDVFDGGQRRRYKPRKVAMDLSWFRQWTRCNRIPHSIHEALMAGWSPR